MLHAVRKNITPRYFDLPSSGRRCSFKLYVVAVVSN